MRSYGNVLMLIALATSIPAPVDSANSTVRCAVQAVFPTGNKWGSWNILDTPTGSKLNANRAVGPAVGYEYRLAKSFGIGVSVGRTRHQIDLDSTKVSELTMMPVMVGAYIHIVQPDLDLYFGPRFGYVFYGDLEVVAEGQYDPEDNGAVGGILGFDIPFGNSNWMFAGSLEYVSAGPRSRLPINPFVITGGLGYRF